MTADRARILMIFTVLLVMVAALPVTAAEVRAVQLNKIAAVVNGEIITLHELRRHVGPELTRLGVRPTDPGSEATVNQVTLQVLDMMISDILLRQEAGRLKINVTDAEVENELRKLVQRNQTTMADFEARLAAQGGTIEMVRERLRNSILSQRLVNIMIARKVVITQDEVAKYYEAHKAEFMAERSVNLSILVFEPGINAEAIHAKIADGSQSFEVAVKQYSIGPAAAEGGSLGLIAWKDLSPQLRSVVSQLKDGQISPVFLLDYNNVLLRVNSSTPGAQMSLEQATPDIEAVLREPRLKERFTDYTKQLRNKAVVDIRL